MNIDVVQLNLGNPTFVTQLKLNMQLADLYQRALNFEFLSIEEGMFLFKHAPLAELMNVADELRKKQVPHGKVTWQIDRNLNTTNVLNNRYNICIYTNDPISGAVNFCDDKILAATSQQSQQISLNKYFHQTVKYPLLIFLDTHA